MELKLCAVAGVSCWPARNTAPHISLHENPYQRTMKKCLRQVSLNNVVFLLLQQRFWIQTYFCNFPQYLCLFRIVFEYTQCIVHKYISHAVNVLFLPSQFEIVHIDGHGIVLFSVYE